MNNSSAAIPSTTRFLFFDSNPGHHYLFDLYGEIPDSQFAVARLNQWEDHDGQDIKYLERSINKSVETIIILTLDPYVYGPNFRYFYDMVKRQAPQKKIFGFLHKLPESAQQIECLTRVSPHIRFVLLNEFLEDIVRELTRSQNVVCLPHHAVFERFLSEKKVAKMRREIPESKIVVSMLGELRDGKGINRLLDAIPYLPGEVKNNVLFLIVGNAKSIDPLDLKACFLKEGVHARVISERVENGYKLVPDSELADYISASDIGLLLFEKSQKICMSGILPNYIMSDVPVIASKDSIVGRFVSKSKLGWVTDIANPSGLAQLISEAVQTDFNKKTLNDETVAIKKQLSSTSVLQKFEDMLNGE